MLFTRWIDGIAMRRRRRRTTIDLYGLSEHQLRDIGLTQHDIRTIPHSR